jgi:hypothetical protein
MEDGRWKIEKDGRQAGVLPILHPRSSILPNVFRGRPFRLFDCQVSRTCNVHTTVRVLPAVVAQVTVRR